MRLALPSIIFLSLLSSALFAQRVEVPGAAFFPPQLKQHMEFTDAQVTSILAENAALANFQSQKLQRQLQVQMELAQETAKPVVDPMALGLRHMELESIRRELQAEQEKTAGRVQSLLTDAQKTKLEGLRQAMALQGVICEAQSVNLLGSGIARTGISVNPYLPGNLIPNTIPANRISAAFLPGLSSCGGSTNFASFLLGGGPIGVARAANAQH